MYIVRELLANLASNLYCLWWLCDCCGGLCDSVVVVLCCYRFGYGVLGWLGFRKGMNVLEHSSQFLEFFGLLI
jgi:hypothetical protein